MVKSNKEYLKELQELSDKHSSLKDEVEDLLKEGDSIKDKLKESDRVFSITEVINSLMKEMDIIEDKYYSILKEYKDKK